tara:strand:- start:259 stop:873 length:615 start_codon:yes stop_codon:yes gene_type:complete
MNKIQRKLVTDLKVLSELVHDLEYFICFGTLLGYARDNSIISYDKDIDIYLNKHHKPILVNRLHNQDWFKVFQDQEYFMRIDSMSKNHPSQRPPLTYVDIQTYQDYDEANLIDYFTYNASNGALKKIKEGTFDKTRILHLPKHLVLPIKDGILHDIPIKIPSDPLRLTKYFYGEHWKKNLQRDRDYLEYCENNRPQIKYKDHVK